jgi:predicted branched-subunit amino acid permease
MAAGQISLSTSRSPGGALREPLLAGARDMAPGLVALLPLALALGASIAASPVDDLVGWLGAALVYGASAHATAVSMLAAGAAGGAVVLAVLVIMARSVIYSAGLVSRMRGQPAWFRWSAPYFLVDPLYALVVTRTGEGHGAAWVRWYYLGAALAIWLMWMPSVAAGVLLGPVLPGGAGMAFALPALLITFLVPGINSKPALAAAAVGGAVGALGSAWPGGLALLLGTAFGVAVAVAFERRSR